MGLRELCSSRAVSVELLRECLELEGDQQFARRGNDVSITSVRTMVG